MSWNCTLKMVKIVSIDFTKHTHTKGQQPQKIIEKIHKAKTSRPLVTPIKKKQKTPAAYPRVYAQISKKPL